MRMENSTITAKHLRQLKITGISVLHGMCRDLSWVEILDVTAGNLLPYNHGLHGLEHLTHLAVSILSETFQDPDQNAVLTSLRPLKGLRILLDWERVASSITERRLDLKTVIDHHGRSLQHLSVLRWDPTFDIEKTSDMQCLRNFSGLGMDDLLYISNHCLRLRSLRFDLDVYPEYHENTPTREIGMSYRPSKEPAHEFPPDFQSLAHVFRLLGASDSFPSLDQLGITFLLRRPRSRSWQPPWTKFVNATHVRELWGLINAERVRPLAELRVAQADYRMTDTGERLHGQEYPSLRERRSFKRWFRASHIKGERHGTVESCQVEERGQIFRLVHRR
ncbi:hypothetical protein BDV98DRAFT_577108 [Pterulicium gracile]|uniref:Uncharacterized protein n=1 Tax=Pterulicium gracile TaxID=1884261 RepID=A0A5C3Q6K1_9AGAR|nr:hypothetical protein BDV98DRAFT_577108 [Pterula gracilis]